jgi:hypothetical protein
MGACELERRVSEFRIADDGIAVYTLSVLCPVIFMATDRGTPARSRFRTAVRRKSWSSRPGTPASLHTVSQRFENPRRAWPARRPLGCGKRWGTMRPSFRCRASTRSTWPVSSPFELRGKIHGAAFPVLCGPGVEAQRPGLEVKLAPLDGEDFRLPPTVGVRDGDGRRRSSVSRRRIASY